jgi:RNA polymerase sigma-70 factor (ECF subfamily)
VTSGSDDIDRRLVSALVRRQDERAFAALYERHSTYLYRFALRLTAGDGDVAQDLVHDAWVRAVQRLAQFEWRSRLRTWLAGFVLSLWQERLRETNHDIALDDSHTGDSEPWREPLNRVDVERALASIAPGFREVLVLHDIEGYTHEDIAMMLGVQPGTSKSQLSRARAAMRRALGESPTTEHTDD